MAQPKAIRKDAKYALEFVKRHQVRFISLWFTDILGFLKGFTITPQELPDALKEGMGFDGSSIEGFARIDESDMLAVPDPATIQLLPQVREGEGIIARMFCDILLPDGKPYPGDPRHCLRRLTERAARQGFTFYVGPELEYFYFKSAHGRPEPLDDGGYFDLTSMDLGTHLRRRTVVSLEAMGIPVEYAHHEVAPSQHEIDLHYADALSMADWAVTYRHVVKDIAQRHGVHATFMPKPLFGLNGSGMHVHMSLFKGRANAFYDVKGLYHLSATARQFIAGLLKYAPEFTAVCNQWVNSYKRLVPGYEAPVYISWAQKNRSTLIRVPMYKPKKPQATRIELRSPDPACNPYLAFAVLLGAGLAGIEERCALPEPIEADIFEMNEAERTKRGIPSLPGSLNDALRQMERSRLAREVLGEHIFEKFIANKKIEWDRYRIQIHNYEHESYLPIL